MNRGQFLVVGLFGAVEGVLWGQGNARVVRGELDFDRTIEVLLADDELTPGTIELEEGRYRFALHNGFTSSPLQLRLDDEKNARVREVAAKAHAGKVTLVENLKPGRYTLWVAQRPKWRSMIVVSEKRR